MAHFFGGETKMNTISELLWNAFYHYASHIAIYDSIDKQHTTFTEVLHETAAIAAYLQQHGVRQNDCVAIVLEREKEYILAEIACLLYGYCAVLLDQSYPQERIDTIVTDVGATCVIDSAFMECAKCCTVMPEKHMIRPTDPAIVIYTSGTTGKPKGVLHSQSSVAHTAIRNNHYLNLDSNEIYGMVAPFTFIASCAELVCSLVAGRGVVIVPEEIIRNPVALAQFVSDKKISILFVPPKILKYFKKQGDSLKIVLTGSERISGVAPGDYRLIAMYGMTETCSQVSVFEVDKRYDNTPVGKPMPDVSIYILDENLQECEVGEICVCGTFMTEYIGAPGETARVKIANPYFEKDNHQYMIRTGDIGTKDLEGNIIYLNRKDYMVKINGKRVDIGEIECAMCSLPQISAAAVKAFHDNSGKTYLCGYYVLNTSITKEEIITALKEKLLLYMIPAFIVEMPVLPTNRNGKIDRQALKAPAVDCFLTEYTPPETEMERKICAAMENALNVSRIGIHDNFFDLGGDSLSCVELVTLLNDVQIDLKKIYQYQTPFQIAQHVETKPDSDYDKHNREALLCEQELTPYQRYYLEYSMRYPEITIANQVLLCSMELKDIDIEKFVNAVNTVLRNHPVYSTVFCYNQEKQLVQRYCPDLFEDIYIMHMNDDDVMPYILKTEVKPFAPLNGLLYRCCLIQSKKKVYLLLDMHHSITDGTSLKKLVIEILDCYQGKTVAIDSYYLALEQYSRYKKNSEYQNHLNILKDLHGRDNYARYPIPDFSGDKNVSKGLLIDTGYRLLQLQEKAKEKNATLGALFVAATLLAMANYNHQSKVSTEWIFSGRNEKWKETIQGNLLQGILVSIDLNTVNSVDELLKEIKKQNEIGIRYSDISYPELEAIPGETEWIQVVYEYGLSKTEDLPKGLEITQVFEPVIGNLSMIQLIIYEALEGENQNAILAYNTNRYAESSMIRFAEYIKESLRDILES